ncbi:hypothetical protein EV424DRAFT_1347463 [Suillus variegatus]|nr:hypothetical protein EV424DRAFT_1347463 [Suillus variegatus]
MLIKEMEIYALGSLVDSGWMHLDGWRHRACKRGNARACVYIAKRGNGIAADSTQSGAASCFSLLSTFYEVLQLGGSHIEKGITEGAFQLSSEDSSNSNSSNDKDWRPQN